MSAFDSTPLLHAEDGQSSSNQALQDHPIFLRASHSPWKWIPQNILAIIRGIIVVYLIIVLVCAVNYKCGLDSECSNWRHIFDFAIVSLILCLIYHIVTFCWTYTHLYYPRVDELEEGIERRIICAMSLPDNMGSQRKQFYFNLFYITVVVLAFMNSLIYWFITCQKGGPEPPPPTPSWGPSYKGNIVWTQLSDISNTYEMRGPVPRAPFSELFGEGWFATFNILNLYIAVSLVMVIEILFLNSIKRPWAIISHLVCLVFIAGVYLAWAACGYLLTGCPAFDWLDKSIVGSVEAVTAFCIGFVLLAPLMYVLFHGFIGIREGLTRSAAQARGAATAAAASDSFRDGFYDNP